MNKFVGLNNKYVVFTNIFVGISNNYVGVKCNFLYKYFFELTYFILFKQDQCLFIFKEHICWSWFIYKA